MEDRSESSTRILEALEQVPNSVHINQQDKRSTTTLEVAGLEYTAASEKESPRSTQGPGSNLSKVSGRDDCNSKIEIIVWLHRDIMGSQRSGEGI